MRWAASPASRPPHRSGPWTVRRVSASVPGASSASGGGRLGSDADQRLQRSRGREAELAVEEGLESAVLEHRGGLVALGQVGADQGAPGALSEGFARYGGESRFDRASELPPTR